ncbi:MAG: sugar-binding domain-containing protein, partial [Schaalia hyovaginalis]|uniref:sugar-binding domain-containing protein n=1 Tax=Schaalia hyovaginalis TaxID=29316 RepID=UPI002A91110D
GVGGTGVGRGAGTPDWQLISGGGAPPPETLRRIPRRLCVVAGASKALPLLGALRARVVTDLVLDDGAARELLDLVRTRSNQTRGGLR